MKKSFKTIKRCIAGICALSQLLILFAMPSVAHSTDDMDISSEALSEIELSSGTAETLSSPAESSSPDLTYTITAPTNSTVPMATITFDKTNIDSFTYEAEGLNVIEDTVGESTNTATYILAAIEDFGTFEIAAHTDGVIVANKTIYTYCNNNSIYTSEASKDIAWHTYMRDLFETNEITVEEWHNNYSAVSLDFSEEITDHSTNSFEDYSEVIDAISAGKIVVGGRMTWETENNVELPMRFTKVELRKQRYIDLDSLETYTDEYGYYYFILDPDELSSPSNVFVRTHTESTTFDVIYPLREDFNYFDSDIQTLSQSTSGIVNISRKLKKDSGCMVYRLAYIQQGMVAGQQYALDMGMVPDKHLYVFHLGDTKKILEEMGLGEIESIIHSNEFACCYDTFSFIGYNKYNKFSTHVHEYGHYVENRMGNYGDVIKGQLFARIPEVFNGKFESLNDYIQVLVDDYNHGVYENHFEELNTTKQYQMELTWTESWATAFAEIARKEYSPKLLNGTSYPFSPAYENFSANSNSGEAQEKAVICVLWDLYDNTPSETSGNDNIFSTKEEWWELTTKAGTCTLQDLSENILTNYPDLIGEVGKIFSAHKISPKINSTITLPCEDSDGTLKINCTVQGSFSYPNDKFRVAFYAFYDNEYNFIGQTDIVSESSVSSNISVHTHTIPKALWMSIMSYYEEGKAIYATVYGYRSGEFDSGPYFSEFITVWDDSKSHTYEKRCDGEGHWDACDCGVINSDKTAHELTYSYYTPTQHYKRCNDCLYMGAEDHSCIIQQYNSTSHQLVCACGETRTEAHYAYRYTKYNNSLHTTHCKCGKTWTEPHVVSSDAYDSGNRLAPCLACGVLVTAGTTLHPTMNGLLRTENGSFILPDGIIVLVDEDIEAYFAGTLEFYYPDDNLETE